MRPGAYDPKQFLADNDLDGVWGSVLYPTEGLSLYQVPDGELLAAIFAGYNDWLAEFCRYEPRRLKGIARSRATSLHFLSSRVCGTSRRC